MMPELEGKESASRGRIPAWRERENNMRRERRRRAIAAKIYSGLRMYGNYNLPKHCDNNEVLKALCREAGWVVEPDGTTYRKGCKPPTESMDVTGASVSASPCSSYQPSPFASYNPSPTSSSFPSPASSSYITNANININVADANTLIPCLRNLSSASSSASSSKFLQKNPFYMHDSSISAPVTPPVGSPSPGTPRIKMDWDDTSVQPPWANARYPFLPNSTPPSPRRQIIPDPEWFAGLQIPTGTTSSPTFCLVSSNPFGPSGGISRMLTPGQSGTCSPIVTGVPCTTDIQMLDDISHEFAFGSCSNNSNQEPTRLVKAWEGERIHEECGSDDLELTLGSSRTRAD